MESETFAKNPSGIEQRWFERRGPPRTLLAYIDEAMADIFEYIEVFYNCRRQHSTFGYVSPATNLQGRISSQHGRKLAA